MIYSKNSHRLFIRRIHRHISAAMHSALACNFNFTGLFVDNSMPHYLAIRRLQFIQLLRYTYVGFML